MRRKFLKELGASGLPKRPGSEISLAPVGEKDLESLPEPARRYLGFMRVAGRPRDWSFRIRCKGRFRRYMGEKWMNCESWQYNTRLVPARIFHLRLRFFGLVPVIGRDTYANGRGRMLIRPLDLWTVGDGMGEAYDIGELVTYLNDGVMMAPSMLMVPEVGWNEIDSDSFGVSLTDRGRTVKARVLVDERGAPVDFETTDRFYSDPADPAKVERCRWTTPVAGWREISGRMLPTSGKVVWHPAGGDDFAYADFDFDPASLAFNVSPGD